MTDLYILDADNNPVKEPDMLKWGLWRFGRDRHVALDQIGPDVWVSTAFLGIPSVASTIFPDHPPELWETMVFGGPLHHWTDRYSSHADALHGHARAVHLAVEAGNAAPPAANDE